MDMDYSQQTDAQVATFAFNFAKEAEHYKKLADDAKAELRKRLAITTRANPHAFGKLRVKVAQTLRFDASLAEEVLPPAKFRKICVAKPDSTLAKAVLTKAEYEQTRRKYDNAITITVAVEE
jgi:hypothetical protein